MASAITIRREWRMLSQAEKQLFLSTVLKLMKRDDNGMASFFDRHAKLFGDNSQSVPAQKIPKGGLINSSPLYLPWRRYFLYIFEKQLQAIEPNLALPYWSFELDSQAPELAPVWGGDAFGGNGMGDSSTVLEGPFRMWQPLYPNNHGLKRVWNGGGTIGPFQSQDVTNSKISGSMEYDSLRKVLASIIAPVHTNIGGDMLSMYSPNDPIFYLCVANIDRLWANWQNLFPGRVAYNGIMPHNKQNVSLTDVMPYFAERVTVQNVISVEKLGYKY